MVVGYLLRNGDALCVDCADGPLEQDDRQLRAADAIHWQDPNANEHCSECGAMLHDPLDDYDVDPVEDWELVG